MRTGGVSRAALATLALLAPLLAAGCGSQGPLGARDVQRLARADAALSRANATAGPALKACPTATTAPLVDCVGRALTEVEQAAAQALTAYEAVIGGLSAGPCRQALTAYRADLAAWRDRLGRGRSLLGAGRWPELAALFSDLSTRQVSADGRRLAGACRLRRR